VLDIQIFRLEIGMPLYIKDDGTARLVGKLAKLRGISKQDAVKMAVQAELDRASETIPLRERFATLRREHPLPRATGKATDKRFFDELSGEL
jgi:antitoxin VapB